MNKQLENFARTELKKGLKQLKEEHHTFFKLMYAYNDGKRTVEYALSMSIDEVVDQTPVEELDWAMQQVQNTLKELAVSYNKGER